MVRSLNRLWLALTLLLMLTAGSAAAFDPRGIGITDTDSFAETVAALRQTGRLPPRYLTKREAEEAGWKPGGDLCRAAPGRTIGGDAFHNREKRLPDRSGRRWFEADLEPRCGQRGAKRLVWSSDGLIYVTTDHYRTFTEVPK
jgi:ribonuclease T1